MMQISDDKGDELWRRLVDAHQHSYAEFEPALQEFMNAEMDRVKMVQRAIHLGRDTATVLMALKNLKNDELAQLFPELVYLASWLQGGAEVVRNAILSLPQEWVIANIEAVAEPLLRKEETIDEYRRLLELYYKLDHALALRLARRALEHPNVEVREAGEDFLKILEP